jgi:nucleoside-diphosphate-sugar epimerase
MSHDGTPFLRPPLRPRPALWILTPMNTLLSLGHGYSAAALARVLIPQGWRVIGTTRTPANMPAIASTGVEPLLWPTDLSPVLQQATHILASAAPDAAGDPFLQAAGAALTAAPAKWVGYLSTTGVYGDHKGAWVDENTPLTPTSTRGEHRVLAENQWLATGLPVHIFRLAGIYGPGRGPFEKVRDGTARRLIKPGQVFSRIHVDDIAATLAASIARPAPGTVYNVCDNDPAPPEDVLSHAARLLGLPDPPEVDFATADLPPMVRSFYSESKRVSNRRIRQDLGVKLAYPDYRTGLAALLANGG